MNFITVKSFLGTLTFPENKVIERSSELFVNIDSVTLFESGKDAIARNVDLWKDVPENLIQKLEEECSVIFFGADNHITVQHTPNELIEKIITAKATR